MKNILPIWLIALIGFSAAAVPAKKGLKTFTQADGTVISLTLVGDENFHSYVTSDGLPVRKGDDGNFYYRTANSVSNVVAHNSDIRTATELSFIKANFDDLNVPAVAKVARKNSSARKAPQRSIRRASQVPSTGSPKIPVILVQYSDYKFKDSDPNATFVNFFTSGSKSAYQYFVDQSNGKYTPQFDVYGPVTLSGKRKTYGGNDYWGNDVGVGKMVAEACTSSNSDIDFSKYDNDGDGECDVVIILYAGDGEASSYDSDAENSIWPCQWELSDSDYGKSLTLDNTKVDKFGVFNELYGFDFSQIDGIGTFCHEFSHCLDLPDFYDTKYGPHFGMGPWSLLDYGCYNDEGYTPVGYSAYEKAFMGWIDLEEGTENTYYTLPVLNQVNADTDKAVKLTNTKDANEYYILENRAQQGWDKYLPTEGMMISHITYSADAWKNNTVNDYDLQRMTIIPADNALKLDSSKGDDGETSYSFNDASLLGDLWPYGNATELTDSSTPAAKVNTGSYMSKPVTEIKRNSDGSISFWLMKNPLPAVATPINISHQIESETSATISWSAVEDVDVTYTVEVSKHKDVTYELVSSNDFNNSNSWTKDGSVNADSAGDLYIGSTKKTGAEISPSFSTGDDGIVTVIFNAKYYGNDKSSVIVSLLNASGSEIDSETIKLTDSFDDYVVVLNGVANSTAKVKFETPAQKNRVYLNTADIYIGDASDLADKAPARAASETLTFSGIKETSLLVSDLEKEETYDYRVKAVPVDSDNYAESAWSEKYQFTLHNSSAVSSIESNNNDSVDYFTIQGIKIKGAPTVPGIYICRKGTRTTKLVIK
jgi:M6 family metalloprotease-like protein